MQTKSEPVKTKSEPVNQHHKANNDAEFSIEDVDEDKIEEILRDSKSNLVVFFCKSRSSTNFYNIKLILDDGRVKCPNCGEALSEVEEIDDDIEATGYIEVIEN